MGRRVWVRDMAGSWVLEKHTLLSRCPLPSRSINGHRRIFRDAWITCLWLHVPTYSPPSEKEDIQLLYVKKKNSLPPCICNRCIWTRSYNFTMLIEFTQRHLKRKTEELIKTWTASQVIEQLLVNKFAANETISQLCFCTAGRHHEVALPFCSVRSRFRQESWR